jgi:hypothetical protein
VKARERDRLLLERFLRRLHDTHVLAIPPDGLETVIDDVLRGR